jgi:hypothetical protein
MTKNDMQFMLTLVLSLIAIGIGLVGVVLAALAL